MKNHSLKIILVMWTLFSGLAQAAPAWTNGHWEGAGFGVKNVYIQWEKHWITFTSSDGKYNYYYWGVDEMPDEKSKMLYSMLLTAFASEAKVSIYRETIAGPIANWHSFEYLNLHK